MNILVDIVSPKMDLSPISRESMRGLKAKTDEANRIKKVNQIATEIYNYVIRQAESTESTSCQWPILDPDWLRMNGGAIRPQARAAGNRHPQIQDPRDAYYQFFIFNKPHIIQALESLFPGCSVDYKMMARSPDGKMYNVSNMDEGAKAFIGAGQIQEYIVIDWS